MLRMPLKPLNALSRRELVLTAAGVCAACWFLFDFFIARPVSREKEAAVRRIEALDAQMQEYYADIAGYGLLEREVASLRARKRLCEERLAHLEEPETMLETLAKLCRQYGIDIASLKPQERPGATPAYRKYNVTMELRCTFQKATQLLAALRMLPVYVTVERLSIRHDEKELVSVSVSLGTFVAGDTQR